MEIELFGKSVRFGKDKREGTIVGVREAVDFGPLHNGSRRGVPTALRIVPNGEEHLEPIEVHPSRCHEAVAELGEQMPSQAFSTPRVETAADRIEKEIMGWRTIITKVTERIESLEKLKESVIDEQRKIPTPIHE